MLLETAFYLLWYVSVCTYAVCFHSFIHSFIYLWGINSTLADERMNDSRWTRDVQVKLWYPLRTRAIPERLRGAFTTRRYASPRLPLPLPLLRNSCSCFCRPSRSNGHVLPIPVYKIRENFYCTVSRISLFYWLVLRYMPSFHRAANAILVRSGCTVKTTYEPMLLYGLRVCLLKVERKWHLSTSW